MSGVTYAGKRRAEHIHVAVIALAQPFQAPSALSSKAIFQRLNHVRHLMSACWLLIIILQHSSGLSYGISGHVAQNGVQSSCAGITKQ